MVIPIIPIELVAILCDTYQIHTMKVRRIVLPWQTLLDPVPDAPDGSNALMDAIISRVLAELSGVMPVVVDGMPCIIIAAIREMKGMQTLGRVSEVLIVSFCNGKEYLVCTIDKKDTVGRHPIHRETVELICPKFQSNGLIQRSMMLVDWFIN